MTPIANSSAVVIGRFLTLSLGTQQFGIDLSRCAEIIGMLDISPAGTINLRGQLVRAVDLRSRLGLPVAERTEHNSMIIVDLESRERIAIAVDRIVGGVMLTERMRIDPQQLPIAIEPRLVCGLVKVGEASIVLLELKQIASDPPERISAVAA